MLTYFEERKRFGTDLYKVRSWHLLGWVLVLRRYEQLTVRKEFTTPGEREG